MTDIRDDAAETTDDAPPREPPAKKPWRIGHYTFTGTAVGLVFLWFSMTPSLLPRGPLFQGLVSGGAGAIGYGLGVFAVWLVRYMRSKDSSPPAPRWAWIALAVLGTIGQILMVIWFHLWQDDVRDFMGVPRLGFWDHPLAAVLSIVTFFVLVEIGQLVGTLVRFLTRQLNPFAPPRVSAVVAVLLILVLTVALLNMRARWWALACRSSPRSPLVRRWCSSRLPSSFVFPLDPVCPDRRAGRRRVCAGSHVHGPGVVSGCAR